MTDDSLRVAAALQRVRELVDTQLPMLNLPDRTLDLSALPRFSAQLPDERSADDAAKLRSGIEKLSPWLQGPFYLGGDVVIEGVWRIDGRWDALGAYVNVSGKRVLDVGCNAGYDPFMFHLCGAREIMACEPFEFIAQARFLESVYKTGIRFEQLGWQRLDPARHGQFDVIHCNGVLYHEPNPLGMLHQLRAMLTDDGEILLGSMMLKDPSLSEYARFVRHDYAGDPTWWWVPGRLALRWMMDAAGFESEFLPFTFSGPNGAFGVINGYVRGRPAEPDPNLASSAATLRTSVDADPAG